MSVGRVKVGPWVFGLLLSWACRGEADAPPPHEAPEVERAAALEPAVLAVDAPDTSDAREDVLASPRPPDVAAPAPRTPDDPGRPPPSVVTPLPELCRQACANTLRILSAELPADAAPSMHAELERSLGAECHGRCLQRASVASARCIASATSALELAECR